MIIFLYMCLFLILVLLFVAGLISINRFERNRISHKIESFDKYIVVLEYHMSRAYEIIYKDKMLIYSLEGMKIDDKEFNVVSKDFTLLTLKLLGPSLKDELIELYGNEETLIFNIIEYFNTRVETDEIREKAKQNMFTNIEDNNLNILKKEELR